MAMNHAKRAKRVEIAKVVRAQLVERFPACFMPQGEIKKPLAIGIHLQIRERWPDLAPYRVGIALQDYTRGPKYLKGLVEGAARIDIDGNEVATVTIEAAEFAAEQLRRLNAFFGAARGEAKEAALAELRLMTKRYRPPAGVGEPEAV